MIATEVTGLVIDAMLKIAFAGETGGALIQHAVTIDDDLHDGGGVALLDRVLHLRGQGGLARIADPERVRARRSLGEGGRGRQGGQNQDERDGVWMPHMRGGYGIRAPAGREGVVYGSHGGGHDS